MLSKKFVSSILVLAFIVNLFAIFPIAQAKENSISFWAANDYNKALQLQLIEERPLTGFQNPLTKAEFLEMAARLSDELSLRTDDIIGKLKIDAGNLNDIITREEAAYILGHVLGYYEDPLSSYSKAKYSYIDTAKINPKYLPAVEYLTANNIFLGYNKTFNPQGTLTYEEAIVVVYRAYEQLANDVELFKGNTYQGFALKEIIPLDIKSAKMYVFEHNKTKAQLMFIRNNDENKTFSITFRTPPDNSKGVQHIIEHMVLDGSEKYPVKNIFFNIFYGPTLATYMNAYTYPVFTSFPIASANTADFNNLMGVYLDSVFNPLLKKNENIFLMEGIWKEIDPETLELNYNGIVYNEMKAYLGNSDLISYEAPLETLLPDTPYAYESGGKPEEIETLTYSELMDYYTKYYHPSNSLTYLYGDVDLIDTLKFIDEDYFSKYEKKNYEKINYEQAAFDKV